MPAGQYRLTTGLYNELNGTRLTLPDGSDAIELAADERALVAKNLLTFDILDFEVFSNQDWVRLHESHSHDVVVNWPDGHHTNGIEKHIEDLKALFVYAPDTRIKVHPIKFGSGDFTCVTGIMEGTFTKPMPIGGGKSIEPTGKTFAIPMCTVGHWKNGVMVADRAGDGFTGRLF